MRNNACIKCSFLLRVGFAGLLIAVGSDVPSLAEIAISARDHSEPQLDQRISAVWKGQTLGVVLDRLAANQDLAFWVDRRVNREQLVDVQFRDIPLSVVLDTLTRNHSLDWSALRNIYYIGPQNASREIATLLERAKDSVQELPTAKRKIWSHESTASWPRLSEPKLLLSEWLGEQEIILLHPELIPHDLWPAKETPPLMLIERVVLLLAGFDLTCQISPDGRCTVVPIERPVNITKIYNVGSNWRSIAARLGPQVPESSLSFYNGVFRGIEVKGRWEDHLKFKELLSGDKSVSPDLEPRRSIARRRLVSLRLENQPLGKVITQLAHQLGLKVDWDEELLNRKPDPRDQLVSCDVENADIPHLMRSILKPVGIEFRLKDGKLYLDAP